MWIGLLWIVGCYGVSIALLHILFGIRRNVAKKSTRVVLITKNNQNHIEWYIRSLFFFSNMRGKPIAATVLDEGSSDDTISIVRRLAQTHEVRLETLSSQATLENWLEKHDKDPVIVMHLGNRDDLQKIPLYQG
ncbi:hypothetical protein B5M42_018795 [Paenibacillus athensensis]|uniref:Uncharacterized protein n=1 Tax=Paenibacillus athensensis TaxID=1967502 RepID=A0A4Y8Q4D5_9BACL|nr:hypothetical protein [Paenibacillus athensensis]MCD1260854.1 hypothetical protein [Paenibacillus athensensis]